MSIELAPVYDGARQANFPVDGKVAQKDLPSGTTELSVRVHKGRPIDTLEGAIATGRTEDKYTDCWLFIHVTRTVVEGQEGWHVNGFCDDAERRETHGARGSATGTDLASCIRVVIGEIGLTEEGYLRPCWEVHQARDARRRKAEVKDVVPVVPVVPVAPVVEEESAGNRMPLALAGVAVLAVLLAITGVAAAAHMGPFATAASSKAASTAGGTTIGNPAPPAAKTWKLSPMVVHVKYQMATPTIEGCNFPGAGLPKATESNASLSMPAADQVALTFPGQGGAPDFVLTGPVGADGTLTLTKQGLVVTMMPAADGRSFTGNEKEPLPCGNGVTGALNHPLTVPLTDGTFAKS